MRKKRMGWQIAAALSALALLFSVLPLYLIAFDSHPYYDDYSFSAQVHSVWKQTGDFGKVVLAAGESAAAVRQEWQGTYTGTLLSNLQPGVFSESYYFLGAFFLLTAFLLCFGAFFTIVYKKLGLWPYERIVLCCLTLALMVQFMPSAGEAFFWFNGGIGNLFVYSLLALGAALLLRLCEPKAHRLRLTVSLTVIMVLLGGGSYPGGIIGLCAMALCTLWLFLKKHPVRWHFLGLWLVFAACFLYSMSAPGNSVRSAMIGAESSVVVTIAKALYYGVALMGSYLSLPLIGLTLIFLPFFYRAAKASPWSFCHPWWVLLILTGLYCSQLTPTLYAGVSLGGWRTINTHWLSFVTLWLLYAYYLAGFAARRMICPVIEYGRRGLALAGCCALLLGCLGYKQTADKLYGAQNLTGVSAAISLISGEAAQYDREMSAREDLLNDEAQPNITLAPLTVTPKVLMEDLLVPGTKYDEKHFLCQYYGKTSIAVEEGE
ncbi:MAG: DUF6056 family protein [Eubacteriales bacterium]|nr:DUF6056 family protein [Eubacteriales bacterium]